MDMYFALATNPYLHQPLAKSVLMVLDEATNHLFHGRYEQGIDLIDEELQNIDQDSQLYRDLQVVKSRLYYHHGRIDQAAYFMRHLLELDPRNEVAQILQVIFQFELGDSRTATDLLVALQHWEQQEIEPDRLPQLSWYFYARGIMADDEGQLDEAKQHFEEALDLRYQLDDRFEANLIHYRLGLIARKQGELPEARKHLEKSLQLSEELTLIKELATAATLLGQDYLMAADYDEALPLLEQGVEVWKQHGSPFGIIWAMGELSIVHYLSGSYQEAIKAYQEIVDLAEGIMPSIYYSNHLFNLFRFFLETEQLDEAVIILESMEAVKDEDQLSNQRYQLANSLIKLYRGRLRDQLAESHQLEELEQVTDLDIKLTSLLASISILVKEYELTEQQLVKSRIASETEDKLTQLMNYIQLQHGITYAMHASILQAKLEVLRYQPQEARRLIEEVRQGQLSSAAIDRELRQIEQDIEKMEGISQSFDFDKEFHSVPTLKLMLYLLPRGWVSFSELQKGTDLSAGHLSRKTSSLEARGYLIKEKRFVNSKPTTMFSLSPEGFKSFRSYLEKLQELLNI